MNPADLNLVLLICHSADSDAEQKFLRELVSASITPAIFSRTHELAGRNHITRKPNRLMRVFNRRRLPSFHFLIGLN